MGFVERALTFVGFPKSRESTAVVVKETTLNSVNSQGGWITLIRESFAGAWQSVTTISSQKDILAYSAVFACVTMIAGDIGKLYLRLMRFNSERDVAEEVDSNSPYRNVLKKPNRYQTRIQFVIQWITSKLLWGNTYVLKQRDARGIVVAMYILDPQRVQVLVATDGGVYYRLGADDLSGVKDSVTVPASEIIHDLMPTLWHPLVGVSPIYACGISATQGRKIQNNSTKFFDNMSRPSGILVAPEEISPEVAAELKARWEENYKGENIGQVAVLGDGMKYQPMSIPAQESQLIEQQKWTVEDVARCFHVPLFKIGGPIPTSTTIEALLVMYYTDCIQVLIESMEAALDDGLGLKSDMYVEFDIDGLIRMDSATRYDAYSKAVKGGWMHPNYPRRKENMPPVAGGDSPYLQQQNYSLEALSKRDAKEDPFAKPNAPKPAAPAEPDEPDEPASDFEDETAASFLDAVRKGLVYGRC